MKTFAIVLGLTCGSLVASAEPVAETSRFVEGGMSFGAADPVVGWNVMATVAGGYKISGPLWAHAAFAYGPTVDNLGTHNFNRGRNLAAHAGAEGRWCSSPDGALCGIAGLDLGGQFGSWHEYSTTSESSSTLVMIPHVGVDGGSRRIRARLDLEADAALATHHTEVVDPMYPVMHSPSGVVGIELAAGVWVAW